MLVVRVVMIARWHEPRTRAVLSSGRAILSPADRSQGRRHAGGKHSFCCMPGSMSDHPAFQKLLRSPTAGAAIVFLAALAARLYVLGQLVNSPYFLVTGGDMEFYHRWALRVLAGEWTDHQAFYGLPLYAFLLAGLYGSFGINPFIPLLCQELADAFVAVLIFKASIWLFKEENSVNNENPGTVSFRVLAAGGLAAAGWTLFLPAQALSAMLMPTAYLTLSLWGVVWWAISRQRPPTPLAVAGIGLLIGGTAMMVATILFTVPLVAAALLRWRRPSREHGSWGLASTLPALAVGVLLGCAPCILHNRLVAGEAVMLSAHGGVNFFIGNNAEATGYPKMPPGMHASQDGMLRDSIKMAEAAEGRPLRRAEVSAFWSAKAQRFIREQPGAWLRLLGVKARNFWSGFQYDDLSVINPLRESGVVLPGPRFGSVAALALPGLGLALLGGLTADPRWRRARWIAAAVLLHMGAVMTVFVTERYRLAAVPGLLILGVAGLGWAWEQLRLRRWPAAAAYVALLTGGLLFAGPDHPDRELAALEAYNSGWQLLEHGDLARARPKLEAAQRQAPQNAEILFALGNLSLREGNRNQAKEFYRATLVADPEHPRAWNNTGVLALEENRFDLAERFFCNTLALEPNDAKAYYLLARARFGRRDLPGAHAALAEALRRKPQQREFLELRGELDTASGPAVSNTISGDAS